MMNKKQRELLKFLGFKVDGINITWKNDSLVSIFFDESSGLFNIKIQEHTFKPGDYDSIEYLAIDLHHMLGIIYELNSVRGDKNEN